MKVSHGDVAMDLCLGLSSMMRMLSKYGMSRMRAQMYSEPASYRFSSDCIKHSLGNYVMARSSQGSFFEHDVLTSKQVGY